MAEHPAVAHLRNAHERAEALAQAAAYETEPDWSDGGEHGEAVIHLPLGGTVAAGPYGYLFDPLREFIAANDPAAVLARVAAERAILAGCLQALDEGKEYITGTFLVAHVIAHLAAGWGWTEAP